MNDGTPRRPLIDALRRDRAGRCRLAAGVRLMTVGVKLIATAARARGGVSSFCGLTSSGDAHACWPRTPAAITVMAAHVAALGNRGALVRRGVSWWARR